MFPTICHLHTHGTGLTKPHPSITSEAVSWLVSRIMQSIRGIWTPGLAQVSREMINELGEFSPAACNYCDMRERKVPHRALCCGFDVRIYVESITLLN